MPPRGISKPVKNPLKKNASKIRHRNRGAKKARLSKGNISFFDSVPDNAIEHAFRFLSGKPEHADWVAHMPSSAADALVQTNGSLSRVATNAFRLWFDVIPDSAVEGILRFLGSNPPRDTCQVPGKTAVSLAQTRGSLRRLSRNTLSSAVCDTSGSKYAGGSAFSICLHHRELRHLPKSLRQDLRTLHIRSDERLFLGDVLVGCTRLRSFSFEQLFKSSFYRRFRIPSMIASCGSRLEYLNLTGIDVAVVNAITSHCKNLRHLKLIFQRRGIRDSPYSLDTMWESLGTKLEHLEIQSDFDLGAVALHCPNVSHLAVDHRFMGMPLDTEDVCKSYGGRLLDLKLSNCSIYAEALARISEVCPNAVIDCVRYDNFGTRTDEALALGLSAVSWQVSGRDADFDDSLFARVGTSCPNLQRCRVISRANAVSVNSFSELFVSPKPKLKCIELHVVKPSCASTVLAVLADKGCLLKEFSYKGPCPPLELLQRFVTSQTELQKVVFAGGPQCICQDGAEIGESNAVRANSRNMGMFWMPILGILLRNRSVTEIDFHCSKFTRPRRQNEVTAACNVARTRRISVTVCGWRYL